WSPGANRWLAVKKLHPQLAADPRYQKLIQKEALSLSLLKHPNIVSFIAFQPISSRGIDGYGEVRNGLSAIVMDYIEGVNLKEWLIVKGPPSFERLLPLFMEISSALAYLHQNNIFHLDLKPENILISLAGKPYLSDFGIASIQGDLQITAPLTGPLGTLEYISPEQVRGEPPDGRSDLYSLGMIFYTLIHGKSFFNGMGKAVVWGKIVYETHPFSLTFPPEIPPYFQSVIRKLVEKEPSRRFPDVQTLLDQVRADKPCGRTLSGERRMILAFGLAFMVVLFLIGKIFDPPRIERVQSHKQPVIQEVADNPLRTSHEPSALINTDVPPKCRTGCLPIEIVFLKKEKEAHSPPQVGPPLILDDHELEAFLMEFKRNVEQKDLGAIEKEIRLSPSALRGLSARERFQEMFRDSREINMEFQQIKREGASITIDYRMTLSRTTRSAQAIQKPEGTLVFQSPSWYLRFSS
ncbi:MAG: serine/threonine protein kinase, partial [Nitrospirae bacterium]|nr:serine/threonine protein kinase [Nitrospirota bacterium]